MNSDEKRLHLVRLKYKDEIVGKRNNIPYITPAGKKNQVGYGDFLLTIEGAVFEDILITLNYGFRPIQQTKLDEIYSIFYQFSNPN